MILDSKITVSELLFGHEKDDIYGFLMEAPASTTKALSTDEMVAMNDINVLPVSYGIACYEQKAVAVLLALLFLGVKGIRLGPTLPGFLSPNNEYRVLLIYCTCISGIDTTR
jgi:hypothetical protein